MPWVCRICLVLSIFCCAFSDFPVRVRLPTGRIARLRIANESTLSTLHQALLQAGFYADNETDVVHIGGKLVVGKVLATLCETVSSVGLVAGDIIEVSVSPTAKAAPVTTGLRPTLHTQAALLSSKRSNKRGMGFLRDVTSRRAAMLRVKPQLSKNITAYVDIARIGPVLGGMFKINVNKHAIALLLGSTTVFRNHTHSSWCNAAVAVLDSQPSGINSERDALDLTTVSGYIVQQTIRLAGLLGLEVVGCALGIPASPDDEPRGKRNGRDARPAGSSSSGSGWTASHVRRALQLRALSAAAAAPAERFVVLSVQPKSAPTGEPTVQLEAYALSSLALELHNRSQIVLTGPIPAPSTVQLKGPVILSDGREVTEVDALLLAVPLPLVEVDAVAEGEMASDVELPGRPFPSLLLMQRDAEVARAAQEYLRRLLDALLQDLLLKDSDLRVGGGSRRGVRQHLLRQLLDPQLLLFLALLLGDSPGPEADHSAEGLSPLAALCGDLRPYLRSPPSGERVAVSAQTLAALEAARRALTGI